MIRPEPQKDGSVFYDLRSAPLLAAAIKRAEEQRKFALAALDDALAILTPNPAPDTRAAILAIKEAIEQLEGRAAP